MKRMTRIVALILIVVLGVTACGNDSTRKSLYEEGQSDSDYIKKKGTLVVGITEFAPLDYKEGDSWIGFDADMAKAFAKEFGVKVQFVEIDWNGKATALENGAVDCVWNGMTLTEETKRDMSCSQPYLNNAQVIIVPKSKVEECKSEEDCMHFLFAVESGSAGENALNSRNYRYTPVKVQKDALEQVADGTADAAVVDSILAGAMVGEGTDYPDLTYTIPLNREEFGVGFRKDSDMTKHLNSFLERCQKDGTMKKTARQYSVQAALIGE